MKNQKILILSGALLLATLVGCGPKTLKTEKAEEVISGFETALTGTVKATYAADYVLDVQSESASAKAFAETVKKTVTIEADYTAGNLYLYAGYATEESKTEALVYQDNGTYYYVESTMGDPAALADEAAALAKMDELIVKVSKTKAGWASTESFLYTGALAYEHRQFLLDSTNVPVEDMDDTRTFVQNEDKGLTISSTMAYVGYTTDAGVSELSAQTEGKVGSKVTVTTDAAGHVVSFNETYDEAKLEMPIMTPAPLLTLTGSHTLTAEYGAEITKKATIDHEAAVGTVTFEAIKEDRKGKIEVYTTAAGNLNPTSWKKVNSGDELKVGDWLCIKVTPAEGNTVKSITYANSSQTLVPPAQAGGYYCFSVVPGAQEIGQNYDGSATIPVTAAVTVKKDSGVKSYELGYMVPPAYNNITAVTTEVPVGKWLTVKVEVEDGYVVDKVLVGETELQTYGSPYYCLNVTAGDAIEVNIKTKTESGEAASNATLKVASATNGSYKVYTCAPYAFTAMTEVTDGAELVAGNWLCVKAEAATGYEVANVSHNGSTKVLAPLSQTGGYYCYTVAEGENKVALYTKTAGATNVLAFAGTQNASVEIKTCAPYGFTAMSTVVDGCELTAGNWICVKITPATGYEIDTVTHNGSDTLLANPAQAGGYYCFSAAEGANTIVVTVKAAA